MYRKTLLKAEMKVNVKGITSSAIVKCVVWRVAVCSVACCCLQHDVFVFNMLCYYCNMVCYHCSMMCLFSAWCVTIAT